LGLNLPKVAEIMNEGIVDYPVVIVPEKAVMKIKGVNKKTDQCQKNYQR